jgi:hypothetical protein
MIHQVNIGLHVLSGTLALILGALAIVFNERLRTHRKLGSWFLYFLGVVVGTGFIGWLFFRSDPFLLMLTILAGYDGFAGYRVVTLKQNHPGIPDVAGAIIALTTGMLYVFAFSETMATMSSSVVKSTLIALMIVTLYDIVKYFFTHRYVKHWWLYEHIYKMIAGFSAIFSAFVGTVVTGFRPYSQLGPTVICMWLIVFFIWKRARRAERLESTNS